MFKRHLDIIHTCLISTVSIIKNVIKIIRVNLKSDILKVFILLHAIYKILPIVDKTDKKVHYIIQSGICSRFKRNE